MANDDFTPSIHDAIALATLLADAVESGKDWSEAWGFARERLAEQGDRLAMAQAHLWLKSLEAIRDLLNGLPEDVDPAGFDRPVSVSDLLGKIAADAARFEG